MDHIMVVSLARPIDNQIRKTRLPDEVAEPCGEIAGDEQLGVVILTDARKTYFAIGEECVRTRLEYPEREKWFLAEPVAKIDLPVIVAINGGRLDKGWSWCWPAI